MKNMMELAVKIGYWLDTQPVRTYAKQSNHPNYYLVFNENTLTVRVARWGKTKRPARTDKFLWAQINIGNAPQGYNNEIYEALLNWAKLWPDIEFDYENSEKVPKVYKNTIFNNVHYIEEPKLYAAS